MRRRRPAQRQNAVPLRRVIRTLEYWQSPEAQRDTKIDDQAWMNAAVYVQQAFGRRRP